MDRWRIRLFDGLTVEENERTVLAMRTRKDDLLLAYLALSPATTHVRTTIVAALWPQSDSTKARKILSFNLFSLKARLKALGLNDALVDTRSTVRLAPHVTTDVQAFTDLVQRAAALGGDQPEERAELVDRAVELYGEGLLPSYRYDWLGPHRSRLEGLFRQATAMRTGVQLAVAGETTTAAAEYVLPGQGRAGISIGPLGAEETEVAAPQRGRPDGMIGLRQLREQVAEMEPQLASSDRWVALRDAEDLYATRLRDVLSQTPRADTIELLLSIATGFWRYWYLSAHYAEGATIINRLLSYGLPMRAQLRARALHASGTLAYFDGNHDRAVVQLREAMRLWQDLDDDEGLLRTLVNLGMSMYGTEDYARALELYEQAIAIAGRQDNEAFLSSALYNASLAASWVEDTQKMRVFLQRRLGLNPATLDPAARAATHVQLAAAALIEGDDVDALEQANQAWRLAEGSPDHICQAVVLSLLGRCEQRAGRLDPAIAWYERSLNEAKLSGDALQRAESLSYLSVAHAAQGDQPLADRLADQARQLYRLAGSRDRSRRFEQDLATTREGKQGA